MRLIQTTVFALIFGLVAGLAWGQALPPQSFDFSFDPIKGAGGYLVEFQDPAGAIVATQTLKATDTHVGVYLVPGPYFLRLTTLNKLGRRESSTDWSPIRVPAPIPPKLVAMEEQSIVTWSAQTITLKVGAFAQDLAVGVRTPDGKLLAATETKVNADGSVTAVLPPLEQVGNYSVVLTNPPNLAIRVNDKLVVHYAPPIITELAPRVLDVSSASRELRVSGRAFSSQAVVYLTARASPPNNEKIPLKAVPDKGDISVTVPTDLLKGEYEVWFANAPTELPVLAGPFRVTTDVVDAKQTQNTLGWISLGTGVVSSGVAIASFIAGSTAYQQYKGALNENDALNYRNQYQSLQGLVLPTAIGGVTTLAAGIILLLLGADK